jgi:hypothetical protein
VSAQYPIEPKPDYAPRVYAGGYMIRRFGAPPPMDLGVASRVEAANALPPVVYYVRIGDHVKIGYSGNLGNRLRAYGGMNSLLALEFGDRASESARHAEFHEHLVPGMGREVFYAHPDLMAHITDLRVTFGLSPLPDAA